MLGKNYRRQGVDGMVRTSGYLKEGSLERERDR
jgi:hypothetical protein